MGALTTNPGVDENAAALQVIAEGNKLVEQFAASLFSFSDVPYRPIALQSGSQEVN